MEWYSMEILPNIYEISIVEYNAALYKNVSQERYY